MNENKMIRYDIGKEFRISETAIDGLKIFAREMMRLQSEAEPEYADCWTTAQIRIDYDFQPSICFGRCVNDVDHWNYSDREMKMTFLVHRDD